MNPIKSRVLKQLFVATVGSIALCAAVASTGCQDSKLPVLTPKQFDCAYHVVDSYVGGNPELVAKVLDLGDGALQVQELVSVLVDLGRSDAQIVDAGHALLECFPGVGVPDAL